MHTFFWYVYLSTYYLVDKRADLGPVTISQPVSQVCCKDKSRWAMYSLEGRQGEKEGSKINCEQKEVCNTQILNSTISECLKYIKDMLKQMANAILTFHSRKYGQWWTLNSFFKKHHYQGSLQIHEYDIHHWTLLKAPFSYCSESTAKGMCALQGRMVL